MHFPDSRTQIISPYPGGPMFGYWGPLDAGGIPYWPGPGLGGAL